MTLQASLYQGVVVQPEGRSKMFLSSRNMIAHLPEEIKALHLPRRQIATANLTVTNHHLPNPGNNEEVYLSTGRTSLDEEGTFIPRHHLPKEVTMTSPATHYQERS